MRVISASASGEDSEPIEVEFLVLHYTAETLEDTLRILGESENAGAHLVISEDGAVHEVTPCLDGRALRAPHAGQSRWDDGNRSWEQFNDFSIGVEIVNRNGNVFPYTDQQHEALAELAVHLAGLYPALEDPDRVVGHEQIAGWRGKADPGACFDWPRFFAMAYPSRPAPQRDPVCSPEILAALEAIKAGEPRDGEVRSHFWRAVSFLLERAVAER